MSEVDALLQRIFDGGKPSFYFELERWVRGSRRYRAFATQHRDKIRSKLRNAQDKSGLLDVQAELAAARMLLGESRFTLEYERYAALKQRGPDFTVTFKTHTAFNVEVRRLRAADLDSGESEVRLGKLMTVVCDKVGQMPAGIINLLWLTSDVEIPQAHLNDAVTTILHLAERKDEAYFIRHNYDSAAAFLRQFQHLGGIVLCQPGGNVVWENALARHKIPPEIANAIRRLPQG